MIKRLLLLLAISTVPTAHARILFEGYYRIEVKGVHRGYTITRHEYDETKKERVMSYYVYRKDDGAITQSGVRAVSRDDLRPAKYSLYEWINGASSVTTGTFGAKSVELTTVDGRTQKITSTSSEAFIPEGIFSSQITQVLAKADPGAYKDGLHVSYTGFNEEAGQYDTGKIRILRSNPFENQMIYQLMSTFQSETLELFTFRSGELLGSRNQNLDTLTYLTANKELAVGDFKIIPESVKKIFGDIPHGATNNPIGMTGGKLDAKEAIKFFPKISDADRKPSQAAKPFKFPK